MRWSLTIPYYVILYIPKDKILLYENEKSTEQKAIDNWLPIHSERSAKWWYSAFHNVTAMVGARVLGFPFSLSQLGW
ncbi:hypothetical protein ACS0TY_025246 [Phlomoides rotata]